MKGNNVIVLGGGIAGLTTAWRLAELWVPVAVFEQDKSVGGLSKTVEYKKFLFDYSAHRFNSDNPEVVRRFKQLVGKHCVHKKKVTYIRHWGRYLTYPPKGWEVIKVMPKKILVPAAFEFVEAFIKNLVKKAPKKSFADWTRGNFGKTLSRHLNEKYAEKIWKRPADQLSSDWAATRIGSFKLFDFILALFFPGRYKNVYSKSDPDTSWFYYSDIGIGYFPRRMSEEIIKLGGQVITKAEVTRIEKKKNKYIVSYTKSGISYQKACAAVVSSLPLNVLCNCLATKVPERVERAVRRLEYLTVLVVNILLDKQNVNDASWIYYPEEYLIFNYVLEFKNWSYKMAPPGKTSLSVNITCDMNDSTWNMKDNEIIKKVVHDLVSVGIIKKTEVMDGFISRIPYAYPIYDLNYKSRLKMVKNYFQKLPGFHLVGRTGNFEYINSDKVMEEGLRLAERIALLRGESGGYRGRTC